MTSQGRAIRNASVRFGDGRTLAYTPCKRGYLPMINGQPMFACVLHHEQRRKRFVKEGRVFRKGEVDLNMFWESSNVNEADAADKASGSL
ncbi:hypothetical protein MPSEU_000286600 [Mayamaea pseudoterrestris]|nr:hypothetical protein MPSEU_000286600 [Mayamaea pseudoterrestris]